MKPFIVVTLCSMLSAPMLFSQSGSINNTLSDGGIFTIKDGSTTFLTLSQSDGSLSLSNIFTLPVTTASGVGVIFKGADRFIHDFKATGTDGNNTFVGVNSGNFTMGGSSIQASYNTAVGHSSLTSLTSGSYNSAFGSQSLFSNTTGYDNSAFGLASLSSNTTGFHNSAFGYLSLNSNTQGLSNSAFGRASLYSNIGSYNSAFGYLAGFNITTGSNNIAIGYDAQVSSAIGNNQIRMGNSLIESAVCQVAWTQPSDRRWKSNIAQSNLGLEFVSKLNPVSYARKNNDKQRTEYGFIAQEIEEVLKGAGVENTGMLTIDDAGMYQLRYNDLLAPMVKAIQELKKEKDDEVLTLRSENDALKQRMSKYESEQQRLLAAIERLTSLPESLSQASKEN